MTTPDHAAIRSRLPAFLTESAELLAEVDASIATMRQHSQVRGNSLPADDEMVVRFEEAG